MTDRKRFDARSASSILLVIVLGLAAGTATRSFAPAAPVIASPVALSARDSTPRVIIVRGGASRPVARTRAS